MGIDNSIGGPSFDQSVPRAELSAINFTLQHSIGSAHFIIDAKTIYEKFNLSLLARLRSDMADLWVDFWEVASYRVITMD